MTLTLQDYQTDRSHFVVTREDVNRVLDDLSAPLQEALGVHTQRQVLWDGKLPIYPVMTQPENNAQWGELMPHWFTPYERPIPLHCLDNWALFAGLFREGLGISREEEHFTISNLLSVITASDMLIAFLPSTMGAGTFLRHGVLTIVLGILWLETDARDAWLSYCKTGAIRLREQMPSFDSDEDLSQWLSNTEQEAFVAAAGPVVAGEEGVSQFLNDTNRYENYSRLFQALALSVTALIEHYGIGWESWVFQAINVHYRLPDFGLEAISQWLQVQMTQQQSHTEHEAG